MAIMEENNPFNKKPAVRYGNQPNKTISDAHHDLQPHQGGDLVTNNEVLWDQKAPNEEFYHILFTKLDTTKIPVAISTEFINPAAALYRRDDDDAYSARYKPPCDPNDYHFVNGHLYYSSQSRAPPSSPPVSSNNSSAGSGVSVTNDYLAKIKRNYTHKRNMRAHRTPASMDDIKPCHKIGCCWTKKNNSGEFIVDEKKMFNF